MSPDAERLPVLADAFEAHRLGRNPPAAGIKGAGEVSAHADALQARLVALEQSLAAGDDRGGAIDAWFEPSLVLQQLVFVFAR